MNDVISIISLVLNFILGTGLLGTLLTLRSHKRTAQADADGAQARAGKAGVELVDTTVQTMVKTVNSLMSQNKELIDMYVEKSEEAEAHKKEKAALEQKFAALEKRVNRMIQTNLKVIKTLEQLGVDDDVINQLRAS